MEPDKSTQQDAAHIADRVQLGPKPPSIFRSVWSGTRNGFRYTSYIFEPLVVLVLLPCLALSFFGLGSGRGWGLVSTAYTITTLYVVMILVGTAVGTAVGLVGGLYRRSSAAAKADSTKMAPSRDLRKLWLKTIGITAIVVLLIAMELGAYLASVVDSRLTNAIATATKDDPHWQFNALIAHREPIADEANSALIVSEILNELPVNWPTGPGPALGEPKPPRTEAAEAYDQLNAAAPNVRLPEHAVDMLRVQLNDYAHALKLARSLANYDRGRIDARIKLDALESPPPRTYATRSVGFFLATDAAIRSHDADPDGALDSCRAILAAARSIGDEPVSLSQVMRMIVGQTALMATQRALAQGQPSDTALAKLQTLILDELSQPLELHAAKGDRALLDSLIMQIRSGSLPLTVLSYKGNDFDRDSMYNQCSQFPWGKLLLDYDGAVTLDWTNQAVAAARAPLNEQRRLGKALEAEYASARNDRFGCLAKRFALRMASPSRITAQSFCVYKSSLAATAILIAAERHRIKVGRWPESVAGIDRNILPTAPADPFAPGQPFRTLQRGNELLIYSIGPNEKDEQGAFDPKYTTNNGPDDPSAHAWLPAYRNLPPA